MRWLTTFVLVLGMLFFPSPAHAGEPWFALRNESGFVALMRYVMAPERLLK